MRFRLKAFAEKTFDRAFFVDLKNLILLGLAFLLPMKVGELLWPEDPDNGIAKVVAIFTGSIVFVVLIAFHKYFSFLIMTSETNEEKGQDRGQ